MKILLDTHVALWALVDSEKLSAKAKKIISDTENEIYYSLVSAWEVAIKHLSHPDKIPVSESEFLEYCNLADYHQLSMEDKHILALKTLHRPENAPKHTDPFDRMLIAQAKSENIMKLQNLTFADICDGYQGDVNLTSKKGYFSTKSNKNSLPLVRGVQISRYSYSAGDEYCSKDALSKNHTEMERIVFIVSLTIVLFWPF